MIKSFMDNPGKSPWTSNPRSAQTGRFKRDVVTYRFKSDTGARKWADYMEYLEIGPIAVLDKEIIVPSGYRKLLKSKTFQDRAKKLGGTYVKVEV